MSTRPVVSYDDITLPYDQTEEQNKPSSSRTGQPPPAKKRKKNNQKAKHRDDFRSNQTNTTKNASNSQSSEFKKYMNAAFGSHTTYEQQQDHRQHEDFDDEEMAAEGEYEEESRELTHQEIWDDSALVDAWEAATEEYEAYHGSEKDWKKEPVKKSPLWYNIPVDPSKRSTNPSSNLDVPTILTTSGSDLTGNEGIEPDSKPIDFDTFVPAHNPSLDAYSTAQAGAEETPAFVKANYLPDTSAGAMVTQDEAFHRALNAMYWSGYWTAMYQCQRQLSQTQKQSTEQGSSDDEYEAQELPPEGEDEGVEVEEDREFVATQR